MIFRHPRLEQVQQELLCLCNMTETEQLILTEQLIWLNS